MVDDFFDKRPRRHVRELNLVPVIDMLTTVIFFLLLSTSFMQYTKLTIPPSSTSVAAATAKDLPLTPKIFMGKVTEGRKILLTWTGNKPGAKAETVVGPTGGTDLRGPIRLAGSRLAEEFHARFPAEKTLQIGLATGVPYQELIALMDGVREKLPDLVLVSYREADSVLAGNP